MSVLSWIFRLTAVAIFLVLLLIGHDELAAGCLAVGFVLRELITIEEGK